MKQLILSFFCFLMAICCLNLDAQIDASKLNGLQYRLVGPFRGGRVTAVAGIPNQPFTFFMGATGGGVWRTTDAGLNWQNVSDGYFKVGSIGAIAVAPSDPNVIYVGTGSAQPRGNVSMGKGVYKSTNGGESWTFVGLEKTGQIGKIVVHPDNPNVLFVAALGNIFGPNPERGVYRSSDAGKTWQQVLFVSDRTGAIDLSMDPKNPRTLYAGMWTAERKPWTMIDGSEEGGVWKSTDGGFNWEKLGGGLPDGLVGKVGVAVSPANSKRVWVLQEAKEEKKGGLYRSDDGGKTFKRINRDHNLRQRAWYYTRVFAHPTNENTLYIVNAGFFKSIDGGDSFSRIRTPHGDNHDLWINPNQPEIMVQSNDGGACVTLNGGQTWTTQYNQPTAEFYRVTVDNQWPYRIYGAQQDNSTMSVPSRFSETLDPIQEWYAVGGGESGHIAVDPNDPNIIYAGNYIGMISRMDRKAGYSKRVNAYPQMHDGQAGRDIKYRFQWNAPIRISQHNPEVVYHCSQYVHKTTDGGNNWEVISPDLTTNKDAYLDIPGGPIQHDHTGVELYCTIFAFEESPHQEGELWAGSDDGLVHISRNGGGKWENITPKDMPEEGTVNNIDLSAHEPGRAFMSVYKYRDNDFRPYIFMTNNYGKKWTLLTNGENGIPADHFVRVVREDPVRKGLLYAGTEFGMYISFDEGKNWQPFQKNLPVTPITDMLVKDNDLVIATQGRSFWLMDDVSPLRAISEEVMEKEAHLFQPSDAYRTQLGNHRGSGAPDPAPNGALVYFYLSDQLDLESATVKLHIKDAKGEVRQTFSNKPGEGESRLRVQTGLNRMQWNLQYERPVAQPKAVFSLANMGGLRAPTGQHSVELVVNEQSSSQNFMLKKDPRWEHIKDEDIMARYELATQAKALFNDCHAAIGELRSIRSQMKDALAMAKKHDISGDFEEKGNALVKELTAMEKELIQTQSESGQDPINYPSMLDDQMAYLYSVINALHDVPTKGEYDRLADLKKMFQPYKEKLSKLKSEEVKEMNDLFEGKGMKIIMVEK
jgi:photosystem II stability/assembly factor-like uncharacterized protein